MNWSDDELADGLEGLLDPVVAETLAEDLACDDALRARSASLRAVLAEPVRLPVLPLPEGLRTRIRERLVELPRDAQLALALEGLTELESGSEAGRSEVLADLGDLLAREPERAARLEAFFGPAIEDLVHAARASEAERSAAEASCLAQLPTLAPSPGLLGRTLARLTDEGLAKSAPAGDVLADSQLAELLEGALPRDEARRVEQHLGRSAAARARLAALKASLPQEARLPELPLPAGLASRVHAALLGANSDLEVPLTSERSDCQYAAVAPAHLLQATLGRLADEGLLAGAGVAGSAPAAAAAAVGGGALSGASGGYASSAASPEKRERAPAAVIVFPPWAPIALAAALLIGLAFGRWVQLPGPSRGGDALALNQRVGELERERAAALSAERAARDELQAATRALAVAKSAAAQSPELASSRADLLAARAKVQELEGRLPALRTDLERSQGELAQALARVSETERAGADLRKAGEAALANAKLEKARSDGALAQARSDLERLHLEVGTLQQDLGKLRQSEGEAVALRNAAQADAKRLEALIAEAPSGMEVARAGAAERWDPRARRWVGLKPREQLAPGTVVRGRQVTSVLQVANNPPYQLRTGTYVVRDHNTLDPLPQSETRMDDYETVSMNPSSSRRDVVTLIERLGSSAPHEQAEAQRALRAIYTRCGGTGSPPISPLGWQRWWRDEGSTSGR